MSKYKQVYRDLKEKIDTRVYKRNTELPSENELVKEYGYSKDTIRKALSMLELDGYIQKIKMRLLSHIKRWQKIKIIFLKV